MGLLGDPGLEQRLQRNPLRFSRLSSVKSLGLNGVIVPGSLGAKPLYLQSDQLL